MRTIGRREPSRIFSDSSIHGQTHCTVGNASARLALRHKMFDDQLPSPDYVETLRFSIKPTVKSGPAHSISPPTMGFISYKAFKDSLWRLSDRRRNFGHWR
jgi:hypothetical protein